MHKQYKLFEPSCYIIQKDSITHIAFMNKQSKTYCILKLGNHDRLNLLPWSQKCENSITSTWALKVMHMGIDPATNPN